MIRGTPVLNQDSGSSAPHFTAEHAEFWVLLEFLEHARHGTSHRPPLVNLPKGIDAHADQKDYKASVDFGKEAFAADHGFRSSND